jgi:hypothetical protein
MMRRRRLAESDAASNQAPRRPDRWHDPMIMMMIIKFYLRVARA